MRLGCRKRVRAGVVRRTAASGSVFLSGSNLKDSDVNFGGDDGGNVYTNAKIHVSFGDGTSGGRLVYDHLNVGADGSSGRFWGWYQWRPNQYFRVKVGSDEDGDNVIAAFAQIVDWGFTAEAKNGSAAYSDYNGSLAMKYRNGAFFGNVYDPGQFSLGLSFFPIEGLTLSLAFPNFGSAKEITEQLAYLAFVAKYQWEGVGMINFAAEGQGGLKKDWDGVKGSTANRNVGNLYLAFYSNELVEGFAFELGGKFNLPRRVGYEKKGDTFDNINVTAGINLTSTDPFNFKLRTNVAFGGKDDGKDIDAGWGIGILPSYKLAKMTVYLHAGLGLEFPVKDGEDTKYQWFVNPYISMPAGSATMYAGLQIISQQRPDDKFQFDWKIPFGFNFYF